MKKSSVYLGCRIINYHQLWYPTAYNYCRDIVKILSLYLEDIGSWMGKNRLKWGPNKTELLFIHHNSLSVLIWRTSAVPEMASPWLKILLHEQAEVQKAFSQHSWCTGCGCIEELFVTIIYVPITTQTTTRYSTCGWKRPSGNCTWYKMHWPIC